MPRQACRGTYKTVTTYAATPIRVLGATVVGSWPRKTGQREEQNQKRDWG